LQLAITARLCSQHFRGERRAALSWAVRDQLSTSIRGYATIMDWTASAPIPWHSGYIHFNWTCDQSEKNRTWIALSYPKGLSNKKETIVRGNARPFPTRLPPLSTSLFCIIPSPETMNEWTQPQGRYRNVVHETKTQTPAPWPLAFQ